MDSKIKKVKFILEISFNTNNGREETFEIEKLCSEWNTLTNKEKLDEVEHWANEHIAINYKEIK